MLAEVAQWLRHRTSAAADWPLERVLAAKLAGPQGSGEAAGPDGQAVPRISVVLPALNEEETVGAIVAAIHRDLVERVPLVDEIVVVDSRSTDGTAAMAAAAGAQVVAQDAVLPELPPLSGKGEALWKSLAATTGDVIVFVDADLRDFTTSFVTGLLGPLLSDRSVEYVKGCYDRPLVSGRGLADGGGRVTELVARPLINLHWPLLAGVMQPLGGEYAARRSLLERLPFVTGYGVEFGLLLDIFQTAGLDALAQVDLGRRVHSHQSTEALGEMSGQILYTAWSRLERHGRMLPLSSPTTALTQFRRAADGHDVRVSDVEVGERPPMIEIPEYSAARRSLLP